RPDDPYPPERRQRRLHWFFARHGNRTGQGGLGTRQKARALYGGGKRRLRSRRRERSYPLLPLPGVLGRIIKIRKGCPEYEEKSCCHRIRRHGRLALRTPAQKRCRRAGGNL